MAQVQIRMAAELHVSELTAAPERGCQTAESKTCGAQDNVTWLLPLCPSCLCNIVPCLHCFKVASNWVTVAAAQVTCAMSRLRASVVQRT